MVLAGAGLFLEILASALPDGSLGSPQRLAAAAGAALVIVAVYEGAPPPPPVPVPHPSTS